MPNTPLGPGVAAPMAPEAIAAQLTQHVKQAGPMLGARIGVLIRTLFPGFSPAQYGAANLRSFIESHVPELRVIGKSGPDPLYGTESTGESSPPPQPPSEAGADLWRIWVSPGVPLVIRVNTETGSAGAAKKGEPVPLGHVVLSPAPLDLHRELARGFLDTIGEGPLRTALAEYLAAGGQWWRPWLQALHRDPATLMKWYDHRQRVLSEALRSTLSGAGLTDTIAAAAFTAISASRRKRQPLSGAVVPPGRPASVEPLPPRELVQIVQYVAARLSERELRSLCLPLGVTLDALEHLKASR